MFHMGELAMLIRVMNGGSGLGRGRDEETNCPVQIRLVSARGIGMVNLSVYSAFGEVRMYNNNFESGSLFRVA